MKKHIFSLSLIALALSVAADVYAAAPSRNDSIVTAVRLSALQKKKAGLEKEIKTQDSRRNRQVAGVAPATLEEMNDSQDSVCLALRSQLTDVILEIKELVPGVTASPQLMEQYNRLVNRRDSVAPAPAGRKRR